MNANASENSSRNIPLEFSDIPVWLRCVHGSILALLLTASAIGNSVVIGAVLLHKKLQRRSLVASLGLVVADLVVAVAWATQGITSAAAGHSPFGTVGCTVLGSITTLGISARWCSVATVTFDRFCNILLPFWYVKRSKIILVVLTLLSWLSSVVLIVPGLSGFGVFEFRLQQSACVINCGSDPACVIFYTTMFGMFLCVGSIFPVLLYLILCVMGFRRAYKTNHIKLGKFAPELESTSTCKPPPHQPPDDVRRRSVCSGSTTFSSSSSSSSKLTSKLATKFSKITSRISEIKAIKTFFLIFVSVLSTQLPIYIVNALRNEQKIYDRIPILVHLIIVHFYLLGTTLDPLMILKNQEVRRVLKGSLKKRQDRNFNKTNTAILLLEMAQMSSLHEVKGKDARYGRRYSCPNIQQHQTREAAQQTVLATSNSCTHCAEAMDTADVLMKLQELKNDVRRASESAKDTKRNNTSAYLEMHLKISLKDTSTKDSPIT